MGVRGLVLAAALVVGIGGAASASPAPSVDPAAFNLVRAEYSWHWGRPHYRRAYRHYGYYRPYRYRYYRPYRSYGYPYGYGYRRPGVGIYFRPF